MMGNQDPPGRFGGRPTGSFLRPTEPGTLNPFEINHPLQFGRRIDDPNLHFAERLVQGDLDFYWKFDMPIEPHLALYLRLVNALAERIELGQARTIRFLLPGDPNHPGYALVKSNPEDPFIRLGETTLTPAPDFAKQAGTLPMFRLGEEVQQAQAGSHFQRATEILEQGLSGAATGGDVTSSPRSSPRRQGAGAGKVRTLQTNEEIWEAMKQFVKVEVGEGGREISRGEVNVLRDRPLAPMELTQIKGFLIYLQSGRTFKINDLTAGKSYIFSMRGDELIEQEADF
jgi:hypothetical protein